MHGSLDDIQRRESGWLESAGQDTGEERASQRKSSNNLHGVPLSFKLIAPGVCYDQQESKQCTEHPGHSVKISETIKTSLKRVRQIRQDSNHLLEQNNPHKKDTH